MTNINYRHIPYEVEAMRVTRENLAEILTWLGEDFAEMHNQLSFTIGNRTISIPERNLEFGTLSLVVTYRSPTDSAQILYTVCFNGDWLVREKGRVYAIYSDGEFRQQFESAEETPSFLTMDAVPEGKDVNPPEVEEVPAENVTEPEVEVKEEIGSMDINDLLGMVAGTDVSPVDGEADM